MKFALAHAGHDAQLRALIRAEAMPGAIRLAYAREPSFLAGLEALGAPCQTVVALEGETVVGMGCRTVRRVYVNGEPRDVGYLSGLRSFRGARRATGLARGYRFLRDLHADGRTPAYLSVILEGNDEARAILTSSRAGLPRYLDAGRYHTHALLPRRRRARPSRWTLATGADVGRAALAAFLREHGARRQFFPVLAPDDFGAGLRDLPLSDLWLAMAGDRIAGLLARWDQRAFRQNIVAGYSRPLAALRAPVNAVLRGLGRRALPAPGGPLDLFFASWALVRGDDPAVLSFLLDEVGARAADGCHALAIGFHERDPLRAAVSGRAQLCCTSRLFLVCWEDGVEFCRGLDPGRIPFLEAAVL